MMKLPQVDLVGVGLNATDTIVSLPHYPTLGSKIEYRNSSVSPGGQVATSGSWGMTRPRRSTTVSLHVRALRHKSSPSREAPALSPSSLSMERASEQSSAGATTDWFSSLPICAVNGS